MYANDPLQDMVTKSTGFKQSSIMEIHSIAGVPFDKIVVGKPLSAVTASNGWALLTCHCLSNSGCSGMMDAATLKGCLANAKAQGWNGGVMIWEWALVNSLDIALPHLLLLPPASPLSPPCSRSHFPAAPTLLMLYRCREHKRSSRRWYDKEY